MFVLYVTISLILGALLVPQVVHGAEVCTSFEDTLSRATAADYSTNEFSAAESRAIEAFYNDQEPKTNTVFAHIYLSVSPEGTALLVFTGSDGCIEFVSPRMTASQVVSFLARVHAHVNGA